MHYPSRLLLILPGQSCRGGIADLVFIVDSSESINRTGSASGRYENWELSLRFLTAIVDRVDAGGDWRIGMVVYSHVAKNEFYLNTYNNKMEIKNAILNTKYLKDTTNTAAGMREARTEQFLLARGDRPGAPNVVFLFTDGKSDDETKFVNEVLLVLCNTPFNQQLS